MNKISKTLYMLRILYFIIQFYFVFTIISNILQIKVIGILFLLIYFVYIIMIIIDLLSKKKRYQNDYVYNIMQISLFIYLTILWIKIYCNNILVTINTMDYFCINFGIISTLFLFIIIYRIICMKNNDKKIN